MKKKGREDRKRNGQGQARIRREENFIPKKILPWYLIYLIHCLPYEKLQHGQLTNSRINCQKIKNCMRLLPFRLEMM